ncbi:MAG: glutamate-1-semialdehyde 2,1-aminomutase [Myxococcota bacterium]
MEQRRSEALLERARKRIPGGVNSPVRAFNAVEGAPPFITRSSGNWLYDEDGNRFLDLINSWGPMILGHAHPAVVAAITAAAQQGTSYGAPTAAEVAFAEELCDAHPTLEMVRLCSSGTEATMHALRLARGFTGRDHIVKIDGCYHGAHDSMLVKAGSGVATFAQPGSPGIPAAVAGLTLTAPFNDADAVEQHLTTHEVAAVILEAVPGNMGCIVPEDGYLERLYDVCQANGTLLIIDEVMTGFRLSRGGATARLGLTADLVALGKIVGGGLPLAAFGGRADVMQALSPVGPVYQAGTLSGNPLAVAAGRETLRRLTPDVYDRLEAISSAIVDGIADAVADAGASIGRIGGMFTVFFRAQPPKNFAEVQECDMTAFARFHRRALEAGVYLPPSQYEAAFCSATLTDEEITHVVDGLRKALAP